MGLSLAQEKQLRRYDNAAQWGKDGRSDMLALQATMLANEERSESTAAEILDEHSEIAMRTQPYDADTNPIGVPTEQLASDQIDKEIEDHEARVAEREEQERIERERREALIAAREEREA